VRVTIGDISRWTAKNQLTTTIGRIWITTDKDDPQSLAMTLFPKKLKSDPEKHACTFYNEDSKMCEIDTFKPISCQTYPLEYDGKKFYVSDKNCPGVGKGEITKEALQAAKLLAEQDFNERMLTRYVLPGLYNVIFNTIMLQQEAAMKDLTDEDKAKLSEIMAKTEPKEPAPEKPKTDESSTVGEEKEAGSE
jgi:Fe-S-cluster containining protein